MVKANHALSNSALVDLLDPLINFYFLHLNLILKLMVAGLLLLLHLLSGMHFHSNLVPFFFYI